MEDKCTGNVTLKTGTKDMGGLCITNVMKVQIYECGFNRLRAGPSVGNTVMVL
jgi:hypothetical protein